MTMPAFAKDGYIFLFLESDHMQNLLQTETLYNIGMNGLDRALPIDLEEAVIRLAR